MVAKINRNYILHASAPVPMVLRLRPATGIVELQVLGEHEPFVRVRVEPLDEIAGLRFVGFGTHGPNRARYLFGCTPVEVASAFAARDEVSADDCDDIQMVAVAADVVEAPTPIALDRLMLGQRSADETFNMRVFVTVDKPAIKLYLHAVELFRTVGSPFYAIGE